jgi:hypothetical protein
MNIEKKLEDIEKRMSVLEQRAGLNSEVTVEGSVIEMDLVLPEADIDGIHFNMQKTCSIFKLKEDGIYYSRDILFTSARDTDGGTGRDLLSEYLDSIDVKQAFYQAFCDKYTAEPLFGMGLKRVTDIRVFIPETNQGIKKYNGVSWWYWLRPRSSEDSAACFYYIGTGGYASYHSAFVVGGCAPAFRVVREVTS